MSHEDKALFAKGLRLFEACTAERDYACVLGFIQHNLHQGGSRAETANHFMAWLRQQSQQQGVESEHAAAILKQVENES